MNQTTEKTIHLGTLIGIIIAFFAFNSIVSLAIGAILHLANFNDIIALGGATLASIILWGRQFKLLSELLDD